MIQIASGLLQIASSLSSDLMQTAALSSSSLLKNNNSVPECSFSLYKLQLVPRGTSILKMIPKQRKNTHHSNLLHKFPYNDAKCCLFLSTMNLVKVQLGYFFCEVCLYYFGVAPERTLTRVPGNQHFQYIHPQSTVHCLNQYRTSDYQIHQTLNSLLLLGGHSSLPSSLNALCGHINLTFPSPPPFKASLS